MAYLLDFENEKHEKGYKKFHPSRENIRKNIGKKICFVTRVICSALSSDEWRRLAGHIDNGFFGSEKTFSAERKNGYYYLNTNKCDDVSIIRVYCQIGVEGIDKIERLGEDTDSWQEVHPNTYKSVQKFLDGTQS